MATFADRLRELRKKASLTQAELALRSGVPIGSVRNYEQGQREPFWDVAFRLASALGVSIEAFADCVQQTRASPAPSANHSVAQSEPRVQS